MSVPLEASENSEREQRTSKQLIVTTMNATSNIRTYGHCEHRKCVNTFENGQTKQHWLGCFKCKSHLYIGVWQCDLISFCFCHNCINNYIENRNILAHDRIVSVTLSWIIYYWHLRCYIHYENEELLSVFFVVLYSVHRVRFSVLFSIIIPHASCPMPYNI